MKIEANELMIGNYVLDTRDDSIHKVSGNTIHSMQFNNKNEILRAIPLTEEWLVKLGFKLLRHSDEWYFKKIKNLEISIKLSVFKVCIAKEYMTFLDVEIKHTHQLQNLFFALTNEHLKIK